MIWGEETGVCGRARRKAQESQNPLSESPGGPGWSGTTRPTASLAPAHLGGSHQPHHHFMPANEVGGLAEQLHIRHRDGARLLPNQYGVVQLHVAPSNRWDQILALHGQKHPSPHSRVRSTDIGWPPCPPTPRPHPSGELVERPPSLVKSKKCLTSILPCYYPPFLSGNQ